jgi:glycogen debranching enzyme
VAEVVRATDLGGVKVLKHGDLYLLTDDFGDVRPDSRGLGLYSGDTRVLSCLEVRVNGVRPVLLRGGAAGDYRNTIQMTNSDYVPDPSRKVDVGLALARRSLGINRERVVAGGLYERLTIANYTEHPEPAVIELIVDVDCADIFEIRGTRRPKRGADLPILVRDDGRITFRHLGLDGRMRWTFIQTSRPEAVASVEDGADGSVVVNWEVNIAPGGNAQVEWRAWTALSPNQSSDAVESAGEDAFPDHPAIDPADVEAGYRAWEEQSAELASDNELFDLVIQRSLTDLRLLSTDGPSAGERYIAAGVPWYTTLFGRDAIITALQTLAFHPSLAVEALDILARRQATVLDEWRDEEPGKILHELRTGEMARDGELPHTPYYGSVDATPLWLVLLGETYDWTGDMGLVERLWPHALNALRWIDEYGTGKNGFLTYERRSSQGLLNQGWKDSGDSIRDRTGKTVDPPTALAEVQGYVYDAKVRMAHLCRARGDPEMAARLDREAEELRARFESAFWLPAEGFYAMAIGRDGRVADALGSNAGQCLWSGIVSPERAQQVVTRLMRPDLDSGWGIRTYASGQPGYNPIGYHTGSVWPHDNAIVIAGLKRYGFHDAANLLAGRIFEAAQKFDGFRLPELYCGFSRSEVDSPVPYPVACSPQAWSAGAPLHLLTSMLGIRPHADRRELELYRPNLPTWLGKVTVNRLRVGEASVDLLFHRWRGTTSAEVLGKRGELAITIHV